MTLPQTLSPQTPSPQTCAPLIRLPQPRDFQPWLKLWEGYNTFYGRPGAVPGADRTWARFFDGREEIHCFVAEHDGVLVGLVHFLYHAHTRLPAPNCYLQDLFTAEAARGLGVGRALIAAVHAHARANQAFQVYWHTHESNATARRLYDGVAERSGFIVYRQLL